ncbi:myoferlin-like isoform X2 [Xenia sp. Carnegie-2017]|uniref:myoferlin-like isoform X2 n=1 Tax=Xenia sp. Carnegie-2017 TaxID=2897299 RepID=UPI001F040FE5|nr:myoferlin-like isoform X2 [Xenia sp. Carnegie-2017]
MSEYMIYASEISATNLPNVEMWGKSDPLCVIEFQGEKGETKPIENELNPVWQEKIEIDLKGKPLSGSDSLSIKIYDHEVVGKNKLLGQCTVKLKEILKGKTMTVAQKLQDKKGQPSEAQVNCKLTYKCPEEKSAAGGSSEEGTAEGDEDDEEDEEGDDGESGEPGARGKRKRGKKRKRKAHDLPNKPMDFQVRLKVVEGRQLSGGNINPVVRVTVGDQVKQTRVKKSTNRPYYNQTFYYNFGNITPDELFEKIVKFEVFNSRKLRSDALIGFFKCDVGLIYEGKNHALLRKWILLTEPEQPESDTKAPPDEEKKESTALGGSPAGYIKTSMVCIAPGNDPPSLDESTKDDTAEDIEANLLQPAGVQLRPAVFRLKIFNAEELPQMDTSIGQSVKKFFGFGKDAKKMVDPFTKFSFAGKSVESEIEYETDNPQFNTILSVPFQFPSMCEKLKIQCYDWDRITGDDIIATTFIRMSEISGQGEEGYLPVFGPSFLNMYGSLREFCALGDEYEDLNKGIGEGVSYRGRILVQLETLLDAEIEDEVAPIPAEDVALVQPFLRRRKYKLYACFMEATMISVDDSPVEFEVSIGNYGNKLDRSVEPSCSTTPPTNPVFDGEFYYYLPWGNAKPCVNVECHWEDIAFRLNPLNVLIKIVDRLKENIEKVNVSVELKKPTAETATILIALLDELIQDCRTPLPQFDLSLMGVTRLDMKNQEIRMDEMACIAEEASKLRESATDVQEALSDIQSYLSRLEDIAIEPQNSMPDVVIWMLSGEDRVAYYRIPAYDLLYNENPAYCGQHCKKVLDMELKYPGKKGRNTKDHPELPALVRCVLWLGLESDSRDWTAHHDEGTFTVFAETYENQQNVLSNWTSKAMMRPKFSDAEGDFKLPKDKFVPPEGWGWEGDWFLSPELSTNFSKDAGRKIFLEDAFECEERSVPGGGWGPANVPLQEINGDACIDLEGEPIETREKLVAPEGWEWTQDWVVDNNRAVDENGWEYALDANWTGFGPVEKTYHLSRRRRWVRERKLVKDTRKEEAEKARAAQLAAEGWEYAKIFKAKFHIKKRTMDLVRRRRWHRKLIQNSDVAAAPVFKMNVGDDDDEHTMNSPRMFLTFDKPHKYQLRAYIYQARDLLPSDQGGTSDPYVRVVFGNISQSTEDLQGKLCPTWDQTLIFESLGIHGSVASVQDNPPNILLEIFDKDQIGKDEFLGRARAEPVVRINGSEGSSAKLQWFTVEKDGGYAGEVLAAFELFLDEGAELPFAPPMRGDFYLVPNGVRPVLIRHGIEVMCWGLRNMKKYQLTSVTSPHIDFEIGDERKESLVIKNLKRNPNFEQPLLFFDIYLPQEDIYCPPMRIKVRDHRTFGRAPVVGTHLIKSLRKYFQEPPVEDNNSDIIQQTDAVDAPPGTAVVEVQEEEDKDPNEDDKIDWWSKYYASIGDNERAGDYNEKGYDKLEVYPNTLERVEEFGGLCDFLDTFPLIRGKKKKRPDDDDEVVGEFKGTFRVYPLPADPNEELPPKAIRNLPPSEPVDCLIRAYIIRAIDLPPQDNSGLADPFLVIQLGKKKFSTRDEYVPNSLNPIFGKMFEFNAKIPVDKDLKISVMDYDLISSDDIIGETTIDLENRFLSKYRAICGLPESYCKTGPNKWRDMQLPSEILESYLERRSLGKPKYNGDTMVRVDHKDYSLEEFEDGIILHKHLGEARERLALHVLNSFGDVVPEHVETRPLFTSIQPDMEQGKLQLFVDIFPRHIGAPNEPVDIGARVPTKYELRVIVWNTSDVYLEESNLVGEQMSDVYIKCWISGIEDKLKTDTHYRSLNGEANFNWRMLFPFDYLEAEKIMVVKKKLHFWSLDTTEERLPPCLVVQVWDNDTFNPDDFIGAVDLPLDQLPLAFSKSRKIKDVDCLADRKTSSLFDQKQMYGWWPVFGELKNKEGKKEKSLMGKVELTLELLTEQETLAKPTANARDEPNAYPTLTPPNRPATSFFFLTSPWKSFKFIIWKNFKWYIIGALVLILIILFIALFLYAMPGFTVRKIFGIK